MDRSEIDFVASFISNSQPTRIHRLESALAEDLAVLQGKTAAT